MTISATQKKTALPAVVFIVSTTLFFWGLGSIIVLFCVPFMALSIGILVANIGPAIGRWFDRDGWK